MTQPIVKSVTVPVFPEKAFERFTSELKTWWPSHRHSVSAGSGAAPKDIVLEPRVDGAIYEILPDGPRADWGQITVWSPPTGFAMTWYPGKEPSAATLVELRFDVVAEGTVVTLTHSGWQDLGRQADSTRKGYDGGWDYVLGECFGGAFQ